MRKDHFGTLEIQGSRARRAGRVDLVHLVCLVHLVGLVQPNKRDKPNKPNNGLLMLAGFFSILPECLSLTPTRLLEEERVLRKGLVASVGDFLAMRL